MKNKAPEIYVLDDDAAVLDSLQVLLETASYRVKTFDTVAKFLHGLSQASFLPACVILDVHLPDGDGRAVSAKVTSEQPDLPVILMSGRGSSSITEEAAAAGAFAFLDKPLSYDELSSTLSRALTR